MTTTMTTMCETAKCQQDFIINVGVDIGASSLAAVSVSCRPTLELWGPAARIALPTATESSNWASDRQETRPPIKVGQFKTV